MYFPLQTYLRNEIFWGNLLLKGNTQLTIRPYFLCIVLFSSLIHARRVNRKYIFSFNNFFRKLLSGTMRYDPFRLNLDMLGIVW